MIDLDRIEEIDLAINAMRAMALVYMSAGDTALLKKHQEAIHSFEALKELLLEQDQAAARQWYLRTAAKEAK